MSPLQKRVRKRVKKQNKKINSDLFLVSYADIIDINGNTF